MGDLKYKNTLKVGVSVLGSCLLWIFTEKYSLLQLYIDVLCGEFLYIVFEVMTDMRMLGFSWVLLYWCADKMIFIFAFESI